VNLPKYKVIADYISNKLTSSDWKEGYQIPSETELAALFSASRMTARKSIDELVLKGLLTRVPSVGTFVSTPKVQSSLLEIRNISDEIISRGNVHSMTVLSKLTLVPHGELAFNLDSQNKKVFKVIIVHSENEIPIQLEERYVNAEKVPLFMEQDFSKTTVNEYLSSVTPLTDAEISVEAVMPTKILRHNLKLNEMTPCLKISRTTLSNKQVISFAVLYHSANKFKLTSYLHI